MRLNKNSRPYKILRCLLVAGGVIAISSVTPLGGAQIVRSMVKEYCKKKRFMRELFLRDLKRLQTRKLIDYRELPNGEIKMILEKQGKKQKLIYDFDDLKLNSKKWDKRWRMVVFDIPDYHKKGRDALRKKLRVLGLYPIQESVFITPYECEKEIDFVCSVFNIPRYHVLIFRVDRFEGEEKFKYHFRI